jgi:murein DD-endopeptidase MepM/ murein hydrolase activator NlpD
MAISGIGAILSSSYLAEDTDIDSAELAYTEWETDLRLEIENAEINRSGYDEYRYNVDEIGHDPHALLSYLSARHRNFTFSDVASELREIFDEQYSLEFIEEIEVRYRTETRTGSYTDADGVSHSYTYEVEVPYNYYILNVNMTSQQFYYTVLSRLDSEQYMRVQVYMMTRGLRPYVGNPFDFDWVPYISSVYGYRVHPITGVKDYHMGIDIAVPIGTDIKATHGGKVTFAGTSGDYGLVVVLDDGKGLVTKYAHCDSLLVTNGQTVKAGDVIAKSGNTGGSTGPHLHFEVIKDGNYLNPAYFAVSND